LEHCIYQASSNEDFDHVNQLFTNGWVLNPAICDGRPLRTEYSVIYHLVHYTDDEASQLDVEEPSKEIIDIQSVNINDLADNYARGRNWYANGWRIHATFAKTVTLVKYAEPS
jgi:hypothetical protein